MTRISRAVSNTVSFSPSRAIETFPHMDLSGGGGGSTTVTYDVLTSTASPTANYDCGVFRKTQYYDNSVPTSYDQLLSLIHI